MVMLPSQDYNYHNQVQQPAVERQQQRFSPSDNNVILSKTVRKEKRKQREKRENRSMERLDYDSSASGLPVSEGGYHGGHYHHLTVKTPMHICGSNAPIPYMDEGMQHARAEPFRQGTIHILRKHLYRTKLNFTSKFFTEFYFFFVKTRNLFFHITF